MQLKDQTYLIWGRPTDWNCRYRANWSRPATHLFLIVRLDTTKSPPGNDFPFTSVPNHPNKMCIHWFINEITTQIKCALWNGIKPCSKYLRLVRRPKQNHQLNVKNWWRLYLTWLVGAAWRCLMTSWFRAIPLKVPFSQSQELKSPLMGPWSERKASHICAVETSHKIRTQTHSIPKNPADKQSLKSDPGNPWQLIISGIIIVIICSPKEFQRAKFKWFRVDKINWIPFIIAFIRT